MAFIISDYSERNSSRVISFPFERTIRDLPNDARLEWLYACLDGHPNVTKKRLIVLSASEEVGFLDRPTASILISALGLESA